MIALKLPTLKKNYNASVKLSKKKLLIALAFFGAITLQAQTQVVNSRNIVVSRVGDGTTPLVANAPSANVSLLEFSYKTPNQAAPLKKIELPAITLSPTVPYEGQISLSQDGRFIAVLGYDKPVGTATAECILAETKKVIARVDANGTVDNSTKFTTTTNGAVRIAVSKDGAAFWAAVNNVSYLPLGASAAKEVVTRFNNTRFAGLFKGQLYTQAGFANLSATAEPLPTSTTTVKPVIAQTANNNQSFAFLDADPAVSWNNTGYDLLYICDISYGISKYYFDAASNTWMAASVGQGNAYYPNGGTSGIIATINAAGNPVIYSVSSVSLKGDTKLIATTDKGGRTGAIKPESTVLAKAGENFIFRGLAFAPALTAVE